MPRKYTSAANDHSRHRAAIKAQKAGIERVVKHTVIEILRRGSVYDTDDPVIIKWACEFQEKIAKRLERDLAPRT